jgi:hypothetical protein
VGGGGNRLLFFYVGISYSRISFHYKFNGDIHFGDVLLKFTVCLYSMLKDTKIYFAPPPHTATQEMGHSHYRLCGLFFICLRKNLNAFNTYLFLVIVTFMPFIRGSFCPKFDENKLKDFFIFPYNRCRQFPQKKIYTPQETVQKKLSPNRLCAIGVWRGVSKGVEDSCRLPALWIDYH